MLTSTRRASVPATNRTETIRVILEFTQSIDEFFQRRKINKDVLLNYLFKQNWPVTRDASLRDIKNYILLMWDTLRA
ncbi:hypothetical protein RRG08_051239 [Elysia crispata]|uniref:Uncharacterized protein n=1 Tax=Elysia crispata TaxID=231223 RepID=A0AAE0ZSR8_9GAST|nr:hypothetical protein RRG08_051239 [Elysia crispata]